MTTDQLRLRQIDRKLDRIRDIRDLSRPEKGWISEIRRALGMTGAQLARRMGVSKSAVHQYERGEVNGTITLETLRKTAAALECDLVYALVPRTGLAEVRQRRARHVAERLVARVAHSMRLEQQDVSDAERSEQIEDLAQEILQQRPRSLWDEAE